MLENIKLYKVLTIIFLPIAYLFAFIDVLFLMSALANPGALILVFALGCLVLYTILSNRFLKLGIEAEQPLSLKSRDWIKVNAMVSLVLCGLFFLDGISVLISSNQILYKYIDDFILQKPGIPKEATAEMLLSLIKAISVFLLITGAIGLVHITMTLRFIKKYGYLFE